MRQHKCKICKENKTTFISLNEDFLGKNVACMLNNLLNTEVTASRSANTNIICQQCGIQLLQADTFLEKCKDAFPNKSNAKKNPKDEAATNKSVSESSSLGSIFARRKTIDDNLLKPNAKQATNRISNGHAEAAELEDSLKSPKKAIIDKPKNIKMRRKTISEKLFTIDNAIEEQPVDSSVNNEDDMVDISGVIESLEPAKKYKSRKKSNWNAEPLLPEGAFTIQNGEESVKVNYSKDKQTAIEVTNMDEESDHSLVHTGKSTKKKTKLRNEFDCDHCDFKTNGVKIIRAHMLEKHNVKTPGIYKCNLCVKKYATRKGLNAHRKNIHKLDKIGDFSNQNLDEIEQEQENVDNEHEESLVFDDCVIEESDNDDSAKQTKTQTDAEVIPDSDDELIPDLEDDEPTTTQNNTSKLIENVEHPKGITLPKNRITSFFVKTTKSTSTPIRRHTISEDSHNRSTVPTNKTKFFFKCEYCEEEFYVAKTYQTHLTEVHNIKEPRVFKCHACDKSYMSNQMLKRHQSKGHEAQIVEIELEKNNMHIICEHCEKILYTKIEYKNHLFDEHNFEMSEIYACDKCSNIYAYSQNLLRHKSRHHLNKAEFTESPNKVQEKPESATAELVSPKKKQLTKQNTSAGSNKQKKQQTVEPTTTASPKKTDKNISKLNDSSSGYSNEEFIMKLLEMPAEEKSKKRKISINNQTMEEKKADKTTATSSPKKAKTSNEVEESVQKINKIIEQQNNDANKIISLDDDFEDVVAAGSSENVKKKRLTCSKCQRTLNSDKALEKHMNKLHRKNRNLLTCPNCGAIFKIQESYDKHVFSEKCTKAQYPCDVPGCKKKFINELHAMNHKRKKHQTIILDEDELDWGTAQ